MGASTPDKGVSEHFSAAVIPLARVVHVSSASAVPPTAGRRWQYHVPWRGPRPVMQPVRTVTVGYPPPVAGTTHYMPISYDSEVAASRAYRLAARPGSPCL